MNANFFRLAATTQADDGSPLIVSVGGDQTWTRDEFESIDRDRATVDGFGANQMLDIVMAAQRGFHGAVARCWDAQRAVGNANGPTIDALVCLHAFLASMRALLDQSDRRLSHLFGKDSDQRVAFETATSQIYDHEPAYRFMYWLRNHAQHHDVPLAEISLSEFLVRDDSGIESVVESVRFACRRDELMEDCSKPAVSEWLRQQPNSFEIGPLLDATANSLNELRMNFDSQLAPLVAPAMSRLITTLGPALAISEQPSFLEYSKDGGQHPVRVHQVNYRRLLLKTASAATLLASRGEFPS